MCGAVGKSGSPISRWMIFPPASSMARARASTSNADSVPRLVMRPASRIPVMAPMINLWLLAPKVRYARSGSGRQQQRLDAGQTLPEVGLGRGVAGAGQGQPAELGVRVLRADGVGGLGGQEEPDVSVLVGGLSLARGDVDDDYVPDRAVRPRHQVG